MQFDSVLFLCVANSARSQMAEGLARKRFGEAVRVQSAGSAPSRVNPFAAQALEEVGIDPADHASKHVDSIDPDSVDLVITLCAEEQCPLFLGQARRMSWAMPDPDRKHEDLSDDERMAQFRKTRDAIAQRIEVLAALRGVPKPLAPVEFHASVRVPELAAAARFYTWLLGVEPKEWTHRYVTFVSEALRTNFVLLVDDGKVLHHNTLYHLGIELPDRAAVVDAHHRAVAAGWTLHKPARTTWRGTPLHELWLKDPGGNLVEIYARLTDAELAEMPADQAPLFLVEA
jgi:protein-tyrosine-phosphatase/catechol 2,3-dioxygenase-like lactoylglutathione lyase family enzyme